MLPEFSKFDATFPQFEQKVARVKEFVQVSAGPRLPYLDAWVESINFLQARATKEQLYVFVRPEVENKDLVIEALTKRLVECGQDGRDTKLYGPVQGYINVPTYYAYMPDEAQKLSAACNLPITILCRSEFCALPYLSVACSWRGGEAANRALTTEIISAILTP